jgi:hypothetical protein
MPQYDLYVYIPVLPSPGDKTVFVHITGLPFDPPVLVDLTRASVLTEATATTAGNYDRFAGLTGATVNVSILGSAEHPQESSGNSSDSDQGGAESGALGAREAPIDPRLAAVVEAWPTLPEAIKVGILAMVQAAG